MDTAMETAYSDDELYTAFLKGDSHAYDSLMLRYGDRLVTYLSGFLHIPEDAEDLMIEAFARIMVKRPMIGAGCFKAYLYKTARHLAARFHQKTVKTGTFCIDELPEEPSDPTILEDLVVTGEETHILHRCLERLSSELREPLWLIYFDDLSYKEAAKVMGVTAKRIDHLLERGKKALKKELEKEGISHENS